MGASNRFIVLADFIRIHFPPTRYSTIADIAGGNGALNHALTALGYEVITYDPAKQNQTPQAIRRIVTLDTEITQSLIVGLHPDAATEIIIILAARHTIPFVIVPCCIMPTITRFKGDETAWIKHLINLAVSKNFQVESETLRMVGKNVAIYGLPKIGS